MPHRRLALLVVVCVASVACSLLTSLDGYSDGAPDGGSSLPDATPSPDGGADGSTDATTTTDAGLCPANAAEDGLVLYLPFDEGKGTMVGDCSGKGNDGVLLAIADGGWAPGHRGSALRVDSASQGGCVDLGFKLAINGPRSIAAWVSLTSEPTGGVGYVVGKTRAPATAGWRVGFIVPDGGTLEISAAAKPDAGTTIYEALGGAVELGKWFHFAVVMAPGSGVDIYVDGKLAKATTGMPDPVVDDTSATARIGCRGDGLAFLDGTVDELRVYDRLLSAVEIAALAAQ